MPMNETTRNKIRSNVLKQSGDCGQVLDRPGHIIPYPYRGDPRGLLIRAVALISVVTPSLTCFITLHVSAFIVGVLLCNRRPLEPS